LLVCLLVSGAANPLALYFFDRERLRELSPARYDWMHQHVATDKR
jgi:hypothetical protein